MPTTHIQQALTSILNLHTDPKNYFAIANQWKTNASRMREIFKVDLPKFVPYKNTAIRDLIFVYDPKSTAEDLIRHQQKILRYRKEGKSYLDRDEEHFRSE